MLISRASETNHNGRKRERERAAERRPRDHSQEYQTANELFEIMAKNHPFDHSVGDSLSASDLVILYKNIEMGTKLMSEAGEAKRRAPNQYIESVVYNDEADSDGSDTTDLYTADDLRTAVLVNNERIDLLSNPSSLENTLCHKFGDFEMRPSNISTQYNKQFLFKDPYIKEQLQNLNVLKSASHDFDTVLPASLLDYICCKRLEDNYNFYMDNIIQYVKHTIEQLKRISNGDYLTEKAKEKWREVERAPENGDIKNAKILATSASIPLQVESKVNGHSSTWDDIIYSEVDIRSLSKILEKKIVVEIPKLICGSYKLFSKLCSDNLVFSCEKETENTTEKEESRLDVVLQLGRSDSGQVVSNINSVMVWQSNPPNENSESTVTTLLPLPYIEPPKEEEREELPPKIIEIEETNEEPMEIIDDLQESSPDINNDMMEVNDSSSSSEQNEENSNYENNSNNNSESSDNLALKHYIDTKAVQNILRKEAQFPFGSPGELSFTLQGCGMSSLPEENCEEVPITMKRKSPTKIRVKSPYENKSYLIEEKKRKKLLEIRERREKKKLAMSESCKITKHRYGKGPIMPRPSSSVTKLSISNKSFYNSIYGQNAKDLDMVSNKSKIYKEKKELTTETPLEQLQGEAVEAEMLSPDINNKKYINRSYYLDDAVTEIMYTEPSECSSGVRELFGTSTSLLSNDLGPIQPLPSAAFPNSPCSTVERFDETQEIIYTLKNESKSNLLQNKPEDAPATSTKIEENWKGDLKKTIPIECRRSIDKIYSLMKKIGNVETFECKTTRSKYTTADSNNIDTAVAQENSVQCSDSGTSLKHLLESSNPSSFSFEKVTPIDHVSILKSSVSKKSDGMTNVVPKVIISTKQQPASCEPDKVKKERKKVSINPVRVSENPLKAISQLLHEFDSVQKTRQKLSTDAKANKKLEVSFESRLPRSPRTGSTKNRLRIDSYEATKEEHSTEKPKSLVHKDRRGRSIFGFDPPKGSHQAPPEPIDRRKKLADIIDEAKEAKGEAVRGPSKFTSRLNTLAQPKKSYVQAHNEEYQSKYGRSLTADRAQRLAGSARPRLKRSADPPPPPPRHQLPASPPLERGAKHRRPASASPEKAAPSYKHNNAPDAPQTHLKNKMVAVETYVKSHYGRAAPAGAGAGAGVGAAAGGEQARVKARVPLVPQDLDLSSPSMSSMEGPSAVIGNKLHRLISNMMKAQPAALAALDERPEAPEPPEAPSERGPGARSDDDEYQCRDGHPSSVDSDYRADIFEDKHVETAVQNFLEDRPSDDLAEHDSESDEVKCGAVETVKSATEIRELESALQRRISVGAFSKRLRIKNLTIAPKRSTQRVLLLQSGDDGSLVLRSTVSKSLKLNISQSNSEKDLYELQSLMNPRMDWNVNGIPMQISTVGYAFPQYNSSRRGSFVALKSSRNNLKSRSTDSIKEKTDEPHVRALRETDVTHNIRYHDNKTMPADFKNEHNKLASRRKEQPKTTAISVDVVTNQAAEESTEESGDLVEVTKAVNEKSVDKFDSFDNESKLEHISYTSSLDMLVGLLNEIQKITACHISNTENCTNDQECKRLETMLINNQALDRGLEYSESRELISITSLDRLRKLDSNTSIYSLYISNDESDSGESRLFPKLKTRVKSVLYHEKPNYADKEVSAEFPARQLTSTPTDVPSLFPIAIAHSTNVTNSLLGILSKPSTQTVFSFDNYETTYSDSSFDCQNKITEISQPRVTVTELVSKPTDCSNTKNVIGKRKNANDTQIQKAVIIPFNTKASLLKKTWVTDSEDDPLLKMKRDILVTVYSMLVLTVFAALSFPDILYYT